MSRWRERSKDVFHSGLDGLTCCLGDLVGEVLLAVLACGVLALAWWGYRTAPYAAVPVGVGILLLAGLGAVAWRGPGGGRRAGRLAVAAAVTAGIVAALPEAQPSTSSSLGTRRAIRVSPSTRGIASRFRPLATEPGDPQVRGPPPPSPQTGPSND